VITTITNGFSAMACEITVKMVLYPLPWHLPPIIVVKMYCCGFCVLPGQVHQVTRFETVDVWFIAIATELVPEQVRNMLEQSPQPMQPAADALLYRGYGERDRL
jgi:hypothetical protein